MIVKIAIKDSENSQQEALLQQTRALQQSAGYDESRQLRVVGEHRLARLEQLGIRQARYFGRVRTKFQLYLAATVANLTLVASKMGLTGDTNHHPHDDMVVVAKVANAVLAFCAIRLAQIWSLVFLTSALLPPSHFPNKPGFPARFQTLSTALVGSPGLAARTVSAVPTLVLVRQCGHSTICRLSNASIAIFAQLAIWILDSCCTARFATDPSADALVVG